MEALRSAANEGDSSSVEGAVADEVASAVASYNLPVAVCVAKSTVSVTAATDPEADNTVRATSRAVGVRNERGGPKVRPSKSTSTKSCSTPNGLAVRDHYNAATSSDSEEAEYYAAETAKGPSMNKY